ncbi:hypothetical protein [Helicobacter sp. MIT 11-5569]|uniref:hypothetical protein n=1 Tax=Helicobacter sp. MIT 11-5569 TaxID=1548151 RepID=UPI000691E40B|nr:hypothetical protein [Helicobacter sp. MIT 11-5569]
MQDFKGVSITQIQQAIAQKKQSFDENWLGRSLAYTPYQPRSLDLKRKDNIYSIFRLYDYKDSNFLHRAKELEKNAKTFIVESLEFATYLRRYVCVPILYDFLILDSYQLLESLVYGADSITLYPKYLEQSKLKELSDYALRLGLERVFCIETQEDLTKAIFSKADLLNINENFSLIPLIPKEKIIISPINAEQNNSNYINALDAKIIDSTN